MALLLDGEPFNHGLDTDEAARVAAASSDPLAHQQNTDIGTDKPFFEVGLGSASGPAGPVRRGFVFNPGGVGPFTAFAWEARDLAGKRTGRFVECLNVVDGDPTNDNNVWQNFGFEVLKANTVGGNPELFTARDAIIDLYGRLAKLSGAAPVIGGFNPASGAVGTTVLINGNAFGSVTGTVLLDTVACAVSAWSNNQITIRIPIGAKTGKFTVTSGGGTDISRDSFTVTSAAVQTVPGPISGLTATAGNGQVLLQWVEPTDNGNAPINDYEIRYGLIDGVVTAYAHSPRTASNITVSGLSNGREYQFFVAAKNAKGTGPSVGPVTATPAAATTTPPPVTNPPPPKSYDTTLSTSIPEGGSVSFSTTNGHKISFNAIANAAGAPADLVVTWNGQTSFATITTDYVGKPFAFFDALGAQHDNNSAGAQATFVDGTVNF